MRQRRRFGAYGAVLAVVAGAGFVAVGRNHADAGALPVERSNGSAIAMAIQPDRREVYPGDDVTLLITVANTGDATITGTTLTSSVNRLITGHARPDGCERRSIGELEPGRSARIACVVTAPAAVFSIESTVTGRTASGSVADSATLIAGGQPAGLSASIVPDRLRYRAGEDVQFRVRVRNTGAVRLTHVGTLNSRFPRCGRPDIGGLGPGQERDYTCAGKAGLDDVATAIVAWGDGLVRAVSGFATVDVIHPALAVTSQPAGGQTDITVANTGDVQVTGLRTTTPGCGRRTVGTLAAGSATTYRCPAGSGVLAAAATSAGGPVTAAATLRASRAQVTVSQKVSAPIVRPGSPITLTVTVRNTGSATLRRVSLRDAVFPVCDGLRSGRLAPGHRTRLTCTVIAPSADVNRLPVVVAEPESGPPLAAIGSPVLVDVASPVLAVTLTAEPSDPFPGDPVRWLLTVANAGDVTVRGVYARSVYGSCGVRPGTLRPGAAPGGFRCTVPIGVSTATNTVTVTGRLSTGERITEVVTARATVRGAAGLGGLGGPVPARARADIPGGPGYHRG